MASRPPEEGLTATPPTALESQRFFMINALRLSGVAFVIAGILIINGVIDLAAGAGYVLLAVGLLDIFVVPQFLARKWRTPPQ